MSIRMGFSQLSSYFSLSILEDNVMTYMITEETLVHVYT